jgi:hypothetical protein
MRKILTEEVDNLRCPLCLNATEDVLHLLGECKETKEIHEKALNKIYKIISNASRQLGSSGVDRTKGCNLTWTPTKGVGQEGPKSNCQGQEEGGDQTGNRGRGTAPRGTGTWNQEKDSH